MNHPEQAFGLRGHMNPFLQAALFLLLLLSPLAGRAQQGNGMYDAIQMGLLFEYDMYSDYGNTGYYNGFFYQDNYSPNYYGNNAQPSSDVWYTFTVNSGIDIDISACGSGSFSTYVHLLDQYGYEVASSGSSGCLLGYQNLPSGTYYIVVEGSGYSIGDYHMFIYTYPPPAPSPGANMGNAINAGTLVQGAPFADTRNNSDPMLGNDIGQPSYDIFYKFTLASTSEVSLSHCGSTIDTYMHLLSSSGAVIAVNDDNSESPCQSTRSYIKTTLSAGTYYVVSEGYSNYSGSITTTISLVPPPVQLPIISYNSPATLYVGTVASLLPINTGGPVQMGGGGTVSTVAGSTMAGFVNGTGTAARFNQPAGGVFDSQGNLYIPDVINQRIRKITPSGVVTTFAGSGATGSTNGTGTAASFSSPYRLARDGAGNIYVSDRGSDKIRKITPSGVVSTLAGSGVRGFANGTGSSAAFFAPSGIAVDGSGNVYVADQGNHRIRKITPTGVVTTLAGSGSQGSTNGTGSSASFNYPLGMSMDASGNLYVADYSSQKIRKVTLSGVVTTFAGSGSGGSADGPAASATFTNPLITAVDAQGNVYVTDMNQKIRKISGGVVSTVAGTGSAGSADGPYLSASFRTPHGMMFDAQGNLFVADTENHKIRKLSSAPPYSISPALPAGLNFNTSTGRISGTPTALSAAQDYTVTASNSAGSSTTTISITVLAAPAVPSQDQNYILTFSPREAISDAASLATKSASEVQQTVQYFDGLGRPMQTVQTKGSPDMVKDIVQPIIYDEFGREAKKYLPYATAVGENSTYRADAITQQAAFYNAPPAGVVQIPVAGGVTPSFARTVFEASPLNRVLEQGAPGETWQPAITRGTTGRTVVMEQGTNNVTAFTDLNNTRMVALYGIDLSTTGVSCPDPQRGLCRKPALPDNNQGRELDNSGRPQRYGGGV